jgi:alpha-tubulin suppressor-like RCC1 family protein
MEKATAQSGVLPMKKRTAQYRHRAFLPKSKIVSKHTVILFGMKNIVHMLLVALAVIGVPVCWADVNATYNSASDVPVTASGFSASGAMFSAVLNFAPPAGTSLTVVNNTGPNFISGTFNNLAQGQVVTLNYGGINYRFVANYYGGSGNDLVLEWVKTRPVAWGFNFDGQIGDKSTTDRLLPVNVVTTGALTGKTVIAEAAGGSHSLVLCSDGTLAAWGDNSSGQLGDGTTTDSLVPVLVSNVGALAGKTVIAIAAGLIHSMALCSDGTVVAWGAGVGLGNNSAASSSVPVAVDTTGVLSGKTVVAISAGTGLSLALCSDGTVVSWGGGSSGQLGNNSTQDSLVPVTVTTTGVLAGKVVTAVACGQQHCLALCSDGTVAAWGFNGEGQLGNNSQFNKSVPVAINTFGVLAGKTVIAISAGSIHSLALCSDGTIAAWGDNNFGQLGNRGGGGSSLVPVLVYSGGVLSGKSVVGVRGGRNHNLARCSDGTFVAWGRNNDGELGNNGTNTSLEPVIVSSTPLASGEHYAAMVTGSYATHNLALIASPTLPVATSVAAADLTKTTATLKGTVDPDGSPTTAYFEYGLDTTYGTQVSVPLSPNDGFGAQAVSAGINGLVPGAIYHYRITASNAVTTVRSADAVFATVTDVAAVFNTPTDVPVVASTFSAAGATFSAVLNFQPAAGTTLTVVQNTGANLIYGAFANLAQGQIVNLSCAGVNYQFMANYYGGTGNDLVLQWATTRPIAWGDNASGQIGDNSRTNRLLPVNVTTSGILAGKTILTEASGGSHTLAVCSDGTVVTWGANTNGQLGNQTNTDSTVPVAVLATGVLAGKTVVGVAAGNTHSLAVCSDGTVFAWGDNSYGQLGNNSTVKSNVPVAVDSSGVLAGKTVVAVTAGYGQSVVLCSDGTVAAWGEGSSSFVPIAVGASSALAGKTIIAVTAGGDHILALCSDGTLAAWGDNTDGQLGNNSTSDSAVLVPVDTSGVLAGKTVVAMAAGYGHSLAVCSDGTLAAWGDNSNGQLGNNSSTYNDALVPVLVDTTGVLAGKKVVSLSAGFYQSLARCSDGTLAAWGDNFFGELGNNSTTYSLVPVAVSTGPLGNGETYAANFGGCVSAHFLGLIASPAFPKVSSLTATNVTSNGATLNGTVNPSGNVTTVQFDYGLTTAYGSSVIVTTDDGVTPQSVSADITGLTSGTVYHYRITVTNAIGTASSTDAIFSTPINVAAFFDSPQTIPVTTSNVNASGGSFSASLNFAPPAGTNLTVINNTGTKFISGNFANLAQGQAVTLSYGGIDYQFIANYYGGTGNDLVLQWAKTRAVAWGYNSNGQIGDNTVSTLRLVPVNVVATGVLSGKSILAQATGAAYSLALCSDGTVAGWGANSNGQLGNSSTIDARVPVKVTTTGVLAGKTVVGIAAGSTHSLALCSDGTVTSWGSNSSGQLGNTGGESHVPVAVSTTGVLSGRTVVEIAAGNAHSVALCSDGAIAAWGNNFNGQLGNSSPSSSFVPVLVSSVGKTVVALAAGSSHTLALCSDGTVLAWGANTNGQLGNNSTTQSNVPVPVATTGALSGKTVVAIAAGSSHSLALCSDGTVVAWGANASGQLGNSSTTQSIVPVAVNTSGALLGKMVVAVTAGSSHSLALCSDGSLVAWGADNLGQLGNNSTTQSSVPTLASATFLAAGESETAVFTGFASNHGVGIVASPPAPVVTTLTAGVTAASVTLNGTVNAAGGSAAVSFDYGLTTSYGTTSAGTPTPVTGITDTSVSANLTGLQPNKTYHYRVRATNAGGATNGTDLTFVTPPDTVGPVGGTVTMSPASQLDPGATFTVNCANWTDVSTPLTYSVLVDDVVISARGSAAFRSLIGPATAGPHTLKARIYDALGNFTETTQNFTVNTPQESWRKLYFGTTQNAGDAADLADPDGDGMSNLFEYVAGLVPTNALSRFNTRVEAVTGQPGQMAIIFSPIVAGRTYTVKYKTTLTDLTWTPLTAFTTSDNGTERTVIDLSTGLGARFYQVEIALP